MASQEQSALVAKTHSYIKHKAIYPSIDYFFFFGDSLALAGSSATLVVSFFDTGFFLFFGFLSPIFLPSFCF